METKVTPVEELTLPSTGDAGPDHDVARKAATSSLSELGELKVYEPARKLLEWGEVQRARHTEFYDLFFDLVLVAAAFQLGNFLKANLTTFAGPAGLVGLGATLLNSWSHVLSYRSRFHAVSAVHRVLDAIEGLFFAAAAHNVVEDLEAFEEYHMFAFLSFTLLARLVQIVRRVELVIVSGAADAGKVGSTRYAAVDNLFRLVLEVALLSTGYAARDVVWLCAALFFTWVAQFVGYAAPALLGYFRARRAVPIHVEYTTTRMGEMIMLALGEGMLSLVLATSDATRSITGCGGGCWEAKTKSAVSFCSGFALLAAVMFVYYRSNSFQRHHHATRRSAVRGVWWNFGHFVLAVGLIGMGVSIKTIHPYADTYVKPHYVELLAVSASVSLPLIAVLQVTHPGVRAFVMAPAYRGLRLGLFGLKALLSLSFLAMLWFPPKATEGYVYLLYACLLALAVCVVTVAEKTKACEKGLWIYADSLDAEEEERRRAQQRAKSTATGDNTSLGERTTSRSSLDGSLDSEVVRTAACQIG